MKTFGPLGFALLFLLSWAASACPTYRILAPRATIQAKTEWLAKEPNFTVVTSEIGAAQKLSESLLRANPSVQLLALSPYDRMASDLRYGKAGPDFQAKHYISEKRLMRQLDVEWDSLKPKSHEIPFAIANTAATNRNNGQAWIGVRTRLTADGNAVGVRLHIRLLDPSGTSQKDTLGKVGINLAYAIHHYFENPEVFVKSLFDGINHEHVIIDYVRVEAPVDHPLLALEKGWPLLHLGATPYLLFNPDGIVVDAFSFAGEAAEVGTGESPQVDKWTLVSTEANASRAEALWRSALAPSPPPARSTKDPVKPLTDLAEWKARRINVFDELKGTLLEIGGGQRISGRLFEAPYAHTIFQALYYKGTDDAKGRYGAQAMGADPRERVEALLKAEYPHVAYHLPHRKFVVVSLVEGNRGWIGVMGEKWMGETPVLVGIEFELKQSDPLARQEAVGKLGINVLYGFFHRMETQERYLRSLKDGLTDQQLEILGLWY